MLVALLCLLDEAFGTRKVLLNGGTVIACGRETCGVSHGHGEPRVSALIGVEGRALNGSMIGVVVSKLNK